MTPYHFANQKNKEKISRKNITWMMIIGLGAILVAIYGIASFLRMASRGPAWLAQTAIVAGEHIIDMSTPKKILLDRYTSVQQQLNESLAKNIELQQLQNENEQLKKELSFIGHATKTETVEIIGKPNQSLFNTLILNAGSDQGLYVGQLVTAQGNLGVGVIADVSATTATVDLFGGPQFNGDVVLNTKNITVVAVGKGSGNFEIHIPREVTVSDGDLLAFPENPNIVVGIVKSILFDPRDPFQTVLARSPVNVQELRFVEVVK